MKKGNAVVETILNWTETNSILLAIRRGLALSIPVIMAGSFANGLLQFPLASYQKGLTTLFQGAVHNFLQAISAATNNILSLLLILTISYAYANETDKKRTILYPICSLSSYLAFVYSQPEPLASAIFNYSWMFTALITTIVSCVLLKFFFQKCKKIIQKLYSEGADSYYQTAISAIFPVLSTIMVFGAANLVFTIFIGNTNLLHMEKTLSNMFFSHVGNSLAGAVLFVIFNDIFWFFGMHGGNILSEVNVQFFSKGTFLNQDLAGAGLAPTEMFTNPFFNSFVMLGGCGATICLLLAVLFVSTKPNNQRLAKISVFPAILNINEPLVLGFPIIFNPIMLIPFLAAPLAMLFVSTLFMKLGLVPYAIYDVNWTTPIIFSGIKTTGSLTGGLLQILNIGIGTAIYIPFVRISESRQTLLLKKSIHDLKRKIIKGEEAGIPATLMDGSGHLSSVAAMLTDDLHYALKHGEVSLYYQPQLYKDGSILGAEALLRWKHPVLEEFVYPPLVIELAKEDNYLNRLTLYLVEDAAKTLSNLSAKSVNPLKISINISPSQLEDPVFCDNVLSIIDKYDFKKGKLAMEITEQISLSATPVVNKCMERLKSAGILFIMDDFGMGHSSMMYLKSNQFSYVKLDGGMIQDLLQNKRIQDIITSIKQLSESLDFEIIAEYVEHKEQQQVLEELGCNIYQGYLYSKAIQKEEFEIFLREHGELLNETQERV